MKAVRWEASEVETLTISRWSRLNPDADFVSRRSAALLHSGKLEARQKKAKASPKQARSKPEASLKQARSRPRASLEEVESNQPRRSARRLVRWRP